MIIHAGDFGVLPGSYVEKSLGRLFAECKNISGEKTVIFEAGDYFIRSSHCPAQLLYITNTCADSEFSKYETPHLNRAAITIRGVNELTLQGSGARFIIDGKVTNAVIEDCKNVEIKDIVFITKNPDMHELRAVKKTPFYVDFEIDRETNYSVKGARLSFHGTDYSYDPIKKYKTVYWTGCIKETEPDTVFRVPAAFLGAYRVKEIKKRLVRIYFASTARFFAGCRYYLYDGRRQYAGIFVNRCKNFTLTRVAQRFNYSLAFVAQDCCGIEIKNADFSPEAGSPRLLSSAADFIQLCMCRGDIRVTDSHFAGAGDDCLNIHGMHFKIKKIDGKKITVSFMHPQSHGYNAFHAGDEIAFINPKTLLEEGRETLLSSQMCDEFNIELEFERNISKDFLGYSAENASANASLYFAGNTVKRIITRGVLATTRGQVRIENNRFQSTSMSGVLLSDDAKMWYESSMCCDVTVRNNVFDYCGETPIRILPENSVHAGAVHKNIKILSNEFRSYSPCCIEAKSTSGLEIKGNTFGAAGKKLQLKNCDGVSTDFEY